MADKLNEILRQDFGFSEFRPGQHEVLDKLEQGIDTFAILPTGGGKTLIYQLFGRLSPGTVVIVSPLISLMQDQVRRLQYLGEKRVVALTSSLSYQEKQVVLAHLSNYKYIYVSPEMLSNQDVLAKFTRLTISLFVIDEAHCVSEWGPDFRPEYQNLGRIRIQLNSPLTLMITATATHRVIEDIIQKLGFSDETVATEIQPVNRENIFLAAKEVPDESAKMAILTNFLNVMPGKGIIYFSSRSKAEKVAEELTKSTNLSVLPYHGGMSNEDRFSVQQQFMNDQIDIICATSAFGMGIDKQDIRFVIHYHVPANLQSYMQEIGRCGRDGKPGIALALYTDNDRFVHLGLLDKTIPDDSVIEYAYDNPTIEFNDESYRVIQYYVRHQVPLEKVLAIFKQRKIQRLNELQAVIDYVKSQTCRRQKLLEPFQAEFEAESSFCCDVDNDFWNDEDNFVTTNFGAINSQTQRQSADNWHKILNQLFLLKN